MTRIVAGLVALLLSAPAMATEPAALCKSALESAAAKYAQCRLNAESKNSRWPDDAKRTEALGKCSQKFLEAFRKTTDKYTVACAVTETSAAFDQFLSQCSDDTTAAAGGVSLPKTNRLLKTGQTTSFGVGSDGNLELGATHSFTDNGDGTITDNRTGLMWEKKSLAGDIHDRRNSYTWGQTTSPFAMNGTMMTTFLSTLNAPGRGFAGYTDWRIPNRRELDSILNLRDSLPLAFAEFDTGCTLGCSVTTCSCTADYYHWSSTTGLGGAEAYTVDFGNGTSEQLIKSEQAAVRAVRGGL